jgi:hypothetical protein
MSSGAAASPPLTETSQGSHGFLKVAVDLGGDLEKVQGVGVFGSATEVAESP